MLSLARYAVRTSLGIMIRTRREIRGRDSRRQEHDCRDEPSANASTHRRLLCCLNSLSEDTLHLSPNAEAVVVALMICGSCPLCRPVQGTPNSMFTDEVIGDGMRVVFHHRPLSV